MKVYAGGLVAVFLTYRRLFFIKELFEDFSTRLRKRHKREYF